MFLLQIHEEKFEQQKGKFPLKFTFKKLTPWRDSPSSTTTVSVVVELGTCTPARRSLLQFSLLLRELDQDQVKDCIRRVWTLINLTSGNDWNLEKWISMLKEPSRDGVTSFVVSDGPFFFWLKDVGSFLEPGNNSLDGSLKVFVHDRGGQLSCRNQGWKTKISMLWL